MTTQTDVPRTYSIGSLVYTRAGLISLFGWLLWGDFVLTMMESVMPTLLPLILKSNGATNREIVVIVSILANIMNVALNPVVSYKSDRCRSRWGRRRPFIIFTTPFVVLFLAAIPFAPEMTRWATAHGWVARLLSFGPAAPVILMLGMLVAGFQFFNLFITAVYSYLVVDVVPRELLGRGNALMRIVGSSAGMLFNYFIFGLAQNHMRAIFVVTAIGYGFFILLMCWKVKEGEHPPPIDEAHGHWWSGILNYGRECFGHSYYWWVFMAYSLIGVASASGVFAVFFYRDEMGFSLDLIGKVAAYTSALSLVSVYPFGILVDRWGCHKTLILGYSLLTVFSLLVFFFAVNTWSLIGLMLLRSLAYGLLSFSFGKWVAEVYPSERFGQFASAAAVTCSIGCIVFGYVCAAWMDWVKVYRYLFVWSALFTLFGAVVAAVVYRKWKALGGPDHYRAP